MNSKVKSKEKTVLNELIDVVDDPVCGWKPLSRRKKLQLIGTDLMWIVFSIFYLTIVAIGVYLLLPFIKTPEGMLSITIAITTLFLQFATTLKELTKPEDREKIIQITTDWNYERIKEKVENGRWLLLKALIRMRTLQKDFKLSELKKYPSVLNEENLLDMLYNLSPTS